ncbi:uncharacterized protein F4807DRAFT_455512 [Annulohypoxylon truncatum]|uniref:uncharacterized protein n=1 Tax=Annulohypoxylon truncatum TaxID=327061 RepID=UPI0020077059|nr:uncharacterized protein F4807DRAFT_455512 [Annulohypoxylon truncatum]KAI1215062.1 hypothetical protein F4807DRAFT_455512 [Annulohypoxylon truncatum]
MARSAQIKNSQGLCSNLTCGQYLDVSSSEFCTEHLNQKKRTEKSKSHNNHGRQLPTQNYLSSFSNDSWAGTATSTRNSHPSIHSPSHGGNRQGAYSNTAAQGSHTHSPYHVNRALSGAFAAGPRFDDAWNNTWDEHSTAPPNQAYSSYGTSPNLFMGPSYIPPRPGMQAFDNNAIYQPMDEYGYGQYHAGSSHYSRPLPTATPPGQSGQYRYQPWTWDSYHQNYPTQDPK